MIQFNNIPPNVRVPLAYFEVNAAQAPYSSQSRVLLLGQMSPDGSATPGQPVQITTNSDGLFGPGSMLAQMAKKVVLNAPFQETWALPALDLAGGVKAAGTIKVGTAAGFDVKVAAKTTGNVTVAGSAPKVVDGVTLKVGDLVFLMSQTAPAENGIYKVTTVGTGANGTWARADAFDTAAELSNGLLIKVGGGNLAIGKIYQHTTAGAITLGTTALTFALYAAKASPNAAAVLSVWIGEERVTVTVFPTETPADVATKLAAAINEAENCPVTAAVNGTDTSWVDVTSKHAGTPGNSIVMCTDYYGTDGPLPSAIFAFVQLSGGSGDPDWPTLIAALGSEPFDWIVSPYSDGVTLAAMSQLLNDASGRWSPFQQIYGHYLCVKEDTISNLSAFGETLNDKHLSVFGVYRAQSPVWCWAAAIGGRMGAHLSDAPELSRPLQTLDLIGILPPKITANRPTPAERQVLYYDGISSYHVDGKTKTVSIDRVITCYRLNEWGSPDPSWLDVETIAQTMFGIRYIRADLTGQWGRAALRDENPDGIQGVATPQDIKSTIIHSYKKLSQLNVYENPDLFAQLLIVERDQRDANRVNVFLPADHVNQLRIIAVNYTSYLQYNQ